MLSKIAWSSTFLCLMVIAAFAAYQKGIVGYNPFRLDHFVYTGADFQTVEKKLGKRLDPLTGTEEEGVRKIIPPDFVYGEKLYKIQTTTGPCYVATSTADGKEIVCNLYWNTKAGE